MRKKTDKANSYKKSVFTDLDNNIKRENQVYVNEEIIEAVLEAKKSKEDSALRDTPIPSTIKDLPPAEDAVEFIPHETILKDADTENDETEMHPDDMGIYDSLFSEKTIVSTQIYTREIDKNLGEDNFSTECVYRVGQDTTDAGTLFSLTRQELDGVLNSSKPHSADDISWYNDLAGLGFSYAAVCGTSVQGIIICEPLYWNNTLYIRHLMVEKSKRGRGIGKGLIEECVHRAQSEGFRAITMEVTSKNGAAIDFYKQMNFNISGLNTALYSNSDILKDDVGIFMNRIIL
ncbi:MAG: GNAT family N-acetyltransferase [Clostridia bacterium]|nr:GNAT family N-acetyltransferase [Clostridia bacterium]